MHPTPYLRTFISTALLRRLGLPKLARGLEAAWGHLYPAGDRELPASMRSTFPLACEVVVDTMVFARHPQLDNRSLAELVPFGPAQHAAIEAGGRALAAGQRPHTGATSPAGQRSPGGRRQPPGPARGDYRLLLPRLGRR